MAKQITDIKAFIELTRRADVKSAVIKTNAIVKADGSKGVQTKFKVRGSKYLYTLVVNDEEKAAKIVQSVPPTLEVERI